MNFVYKRKGGGPGNEKNWFQNFKDLNKFISSFKNGVERKR